MSIRLVTENGDVLSIVTEQTSYSHHNSGHKIMFHYYLHVLYINDLQFCPTLFTPNDLIHVIRKSMEIRDTFSSSNDQYLFY